MPPKTQLQVFDPFGKGEVPEPTPTPGPILGPPTGGETGTIPISANELRGLVQQEERIVNVIGQNLFDPFTGAFIGVLTQPRSGIGALDIVTADGRRIPFTGEVGHGALSPTGSGTGTFLIEQLGGLAFVEVDQEGNVVDDRRATQTDLTRIFGQTGTGPSGPTFEQTRQLASEAHERNLELEEIRNENSIRLRLLSDSTALANNAADLRAQARIILAELAQQDPIRMAALLQGRASRFGTPTDIFKTELTGAANLQLPEVNPNAPIDVLSGQVESGRELIRTGLPTTPQLGTFLMAGGGAIEKRGVTQMGGQGQAIIVGEAGPEILLHEGNRIRVVPLVGSAQEGATLEFDPETVKDVLAPVFTELGFDTLPTFTGGQGEPITLTGGIAGDPAQTLSMLGVRPRVIRNPLTGEFIFLDPNTGRSHVIAPGIIGEAGFRMGDVVNLDPSTANLAQFGITDPGIAITGADFFTQLNRSGGLNPFSPLGAPLRLNQDINVLLARPGALTAILRRADTLTQAVIANVLDVAGISIGAQQREQQLTSPPGERVGSFKAASFG